jgi:polar amino acid transport system substrate-binding protein
LSEAVKLDYPQRSAFLEKTGTENVLFVWSGRYDFTYEEEGKDYPYAYVRWTEQRNMEAFLGLLGSGKLNIKPLISHVFGIEDAINAYDLVLGKKAEPYVGILLKYNNHGEKLHSKVDSRYNPLAEINTGFIGAGSFAQSLPDP